MKPRRKFNNGSQNMRPVHSINDLPRLPLANAKHRSEFVRAQLLILVQLSHGDDLFCCHLRDPHSLPSRTEVRFQFEHSSILSGTVCHVFIMGACPQMCWIYTAWIIAGVTYIQSFQERPVVELEGKAMRPDLRSVPSKKASVSATRGASRPVPALIIRATAHVLPEPRLLVKRAIRIALSRAEQSGFYCRHEAAFAGGACGHDG